MNHALLSLLQILSMLAPLILSAYPAKLRITPPTPANQIAEMNLSCDAHHFNISLKMQSPFKGLVFAKDFAQECRSVGTMESIITISFPTDKCGVRLDFVPNKGRTEMVYSVNLILQQDRHLRQFTDQEKILDCKLNEKAFLIKSKSLEKSLQNEVKRGRKNHRVGRMRDAGWSKDLEGSQLEEELTEALASARAWMEITPEHPEGKPAGTLQVGESALLTIKSTLPAGIGWKVVECFAHDGLGDSSQKLLDELGCPVDEVLMPLPRYGPIRPIALMQHQEAFASFPAFKFPDRDRLHFSCSLQLCSGSCSRNDCANGTDSSLIRTGKNIPGGRNSEGPILDRIEVFNSVEVLAPEIDDMNKNNQIDIDGSETYPFTNIPGDRAFCISPNKVAIAFCILGLIFLIAVIITTFSLLKSSREDKTLTPYSSRSVFSSSSSGSGFGSKLLPDSPRMVTSSTGGMQYGRIF